MSLLRRIGLSGCVESTTHRGPSDDDILESVDPLKLSSVEYHEILTILTVSTILLCLTILTMSYCILD